MRKLTLHIRLSLGLQFILLVEAVVAFWHQQWPTGLITAAILLVTLTPIFIRRFFKIFIPPEFVLFVIIFVFASLFLGEIRDYYTRYWWWDIALHSSSGILLGIVGFLLVHVLNETEDVGLYMKPGFVAFFSFLFAVGMGAIWEIFEFSMDGLFGMNMQKPMLDDPSGLTDTMWDLIVDTIGALIISVLGYSYLKTAKNQSFLERWINAFIKNNPQLFKR
ncbi:hypothetical protein NO559_11540 [Dasania sp. GY-MA-18]|uniref:DUF2238 domain-containing protein n=1 Tax=Dasania phycosphaerae TaxID=2950436 RepID=A0A9J6RMU2_9GAMM|nr:MULTISPECIES: hypothetical protein [Dasania]MCR8923410.1 hypothetical protein [Dasania sp. GY-MA-18]MCZ0865843.1 hypothetical protein [Dasania phycosphaerae]MCZ0869567.1 hypothetical protein [Dasania phycosphaerae]